MGIPCEPLAPGQVLGSQQDARSDPKFLLPFPTEPAVWGGRGRRFWRGKEEGRSCLEGSEPRELSGGAVLGAVHVHISSLKFREELKEKLWQSHRFFHRLDFRHKALSISKATELSLGEVGSFQVGNGSVIPPPWISIE